MLLPLLPLALLFTFCLTSFLFSLYLLNANSFLPYYQHPKAFLFLQLLNFPHHSNIHYIFFFLLPFFLHTSIQPFYFQSPSVYLRCQPLLIFSFFCETHFLLDLFFMTLHSHSHSPSCHL